MTPILYSYRRCPYAIRARMALQYAGIQHETREVSLRLKPQSLLDLSPKATVPVLKVGDLVLDQSVDIMRWALAQSDPDGWLNGDTTIADAWILKNDGSFKALLDQYKYPNRHPELNQEDTFNAAVNLMLLPLEKALQASHFILGPRLSWVDIALFPFVRQFAMVEPNRFDVLALPLTQRWLNGHLDSELFQSIMQKHPTWQD